jgi:glycolate oxidase subunit GlcD
MTLAPQRTVETLREIEGADGVLTGGAMRPYLHDATEARGLKGSADAVVRPRDAQGVAAVMAWCYEHDIPITPQGGRTGYAGGAVPGGGVVVSLERLRDVRAFDALLWRGEFEAGTTTADVRRLARENGLVFPPDPGAAEQSQLGGNVATNAGGPHAFKYGVTGAWVTGLEVVIPPGDVVRLGGFARKDVAGYDLKSLLIGSEGTLGIITAVSLRFIPAPEAALPLIAVYTDERAGAEAVADCLASGIIPAALEYLDAEAIDVVRGGFPGTLPANARFAVIAEADGTWAEAAAGRTALRDVLAPAALAIEEPSTSSSVKALWRWRDGVGIAADTALGAKVSEDIVVPIDHLAEAIEGTREIAARHNLRSCSWGHAGDGNLHSTFMFARDDESARGRAIAAAEELFTLAVRLGGSVSGEHGVGVTKSGQLRGQWTERAVELHSELKRLFDPKGLLNPGKKAA